MGKSLEVQRREVRDSELARSDRKKFSADLLARLDARYVEKIKAIPEELWDLPIDSLKKVGEIGETVELLRDAFWAEYDRAVFSNRDIHLCNVYDGICSERTFRYKVSESYAALLYMLTPVVRYEAHLRTLLRTKGSDIIKTILEADNYTEGRLDTGIASLQLRTLKQMEDRIKGLPVQRVENYEARIDLSSDMSKDDILKKIEDIEKGIKALNGGKTNDTVEDVEWSESNSDKEPSDVL